MSSDNEKLQVEDKLDGITQQEAYKKYAELMPFPWLVGYLSCNHGGRLL